MPRFIIRDFGGSLQFNGSNARVDFPDVGLNTATAITISMWARIPRDFATRNQGMFDTAPGAVGAVRIYADGSGNVGCDIGGGSGAVTVPLNTLTGLYSNWSHWCLSFSSPTTSTLYYNGAQVATVTSTQRMLSNVFRIGSYNSAFFGGGLDEIIVHKNYTWTATDVTNYYYGGTVPPNPTLFAKLNDASGTSASDSSGNGNTGTLFNSPNWSTDVFMKARSVAS